MDRMRIDIEGMSCGHCVGAVKRALQSVEGVQVEEVAIGSATVTYDPAAVSPERITGAIEDEGYVVASTGR
jgi:copper chaperone CopZ